MALSKTIKGAGNADLNYHMIQSGSLTKNVKDNTYRVNFELISWVDKDTRDNSPEKGTLATRIYQKDISEADMAHIIDYLGLYDYVKANDPMTDSNEGKIFSDATDVL